VHPDITTAQQSHWRSGEIQQLAKQLQEQSKNLKTEKLRMFSLSSYPPHQIATFSLQNFLSFLP
jgi:hypothetical protein